MLLGALWMGNAAATPASLSVTPMPALLIAAICVAAVSLVCAAAETNDDRLLPLQLAFPSIFAIAGCMTGVEWLRFGLLESAALLSIVPVWKAARTRTTRLVYPAVVVFSGMCMGMSHTDGQAGTPGLEPRTSVHRSVHEVRRDSVLLLAVASRR